MNPIEVDLLSSRVTGFVYQPVYGTDPTPRLRRALRVGLRHPTPCLALRPSAA
jgi:hypothetical protein